MFARQPEEALMSLQVSHPRLVPSRLSLGLIALLTVMLLGSAPSARSNTETWTPGGSSNGGNGTWDTVTANWNTNQLWTNGNAASFSGTGGTVTVTAVTANALTFAASGPYLLQSGTLTLSNDSITANSSVTIGSAVTAESGLVLTGTGALTLTGFTNADSNNVTVNLATLNINSGGTLACGYATIGLSGGPVSTVTVSGSGSELLSGYPLYVGESGTATLLIQNHASVNSEEYAFIGDEAGSSGSVTVSGSGSTLSGNDGGFVVGNSGSGTLLITGGATANDGITDIGEQVDSTGSITVTGSGSEFSPSGTVYIGESGTGSLTVSSGGTVALTGNSVYIGNNAGSAGTVTISGAGTSMSNASAAITVGESGSGTLVIDGTGSISFFSLYAGDNTGSTGTVTIDGTGSTLDIGDEMNVGDSGTASLLIENGGSVTNNSNSIVGYDQGGSGSVTITGSNSKWITSAFTGGSVTVGESGSGSVLVENHGLMTTVGYGIIGDNGYGTVTVTGTGSKWTYTEALYVGNSGTGSLVIDSGGVVSNTTGGFTYLGDNAGSVGSVTVSGSGSTWTNPSDLYIGYSGAGMLDVDSGGVVTNNSGQYGAVIAFDVDSSGTAAISGTGAKWTDNGILEVGGSGTGVLEITGSGLVTNDDGFAGYNPGSNGSVTVSGTGSEWKNLGLLVIGEYGSGTLAVSGHGLVSSSSGYIGDVGVGAVTVSGSGSDWDVAGDLYVGNYGSGTLAVTGSGLVTGTIGYIGDEAGSTGSVTVSGSGSKWTNTGNVYVGASGTGTLLIQGGGVVSGDNGYIGFGSGSTGSATVSGTGSKWSLLADLFVGDSGFGSLYVGQEATLSAAKTTVSSLGLLTLAQDPTVSTPLVINGGTLSLVDGVVDTVTLTSTTTIDAGSTLDFEVGAGADKLARSGTAGIGFSGASTVDVYGLAGQITTGTDVLIAADPFTDLSLGNVYNGGDFLYKLVATSTSENLVVTATTGLSQEYWKGGHGDVWSAVVGGTASNWTSDAGGTTDPLVTPGSATDVTFSATSPANEGNTLLGDNVTINSLTVSDTNAVSVSGSDALGGNDTLTVSGTSGTTGINVNPGAGLVSVGANLDLTGSFQTITVNNSAGMEVSGTVGSSGGLTKSGTGTLTLSGQGTYSGATNVTAGRLIVTGSLAGTVSATVATGADLEVDGLLNPASPTSVSGTLSGIGAVGPVILNSGGVLAPGLSTVQSGTGALAVSGGVSLATSSTFALRIGINVASAADQLDVLSGAVALDGASLQLTIGSALNSPADLGLTYVIINGGATDTGSGFSNTFAQGSSITTPGGYKFDILYASNSAGTGAGSDVVLDLVAIPEPGTWGLFAGGIGVLVVIRRFGRRRT
jgi:T5SS/PEP-CTERM-associated repeat protein/autotransporter-associated beta strand protein